MDEHDPSPTLLLVSDDEALAELVLEVVKRPWELARHRSDGYASLKMLTQPNVRLVVLDDEGVKESDRSWLLVQIHQRFIGSPIIYVAHRPSEGTERLARTNGAHYYDSKPLALERFGQVLESFLRIQQVKR
ncbi:MAG TPA: response regulator [Candidatus Acidoferrales bacterium]|nr:response regulator [Candidatus Acidoferrales bacterium]